MGLGSVDTAAQFCVDRAAVWRHALLSVYTQEPGVAFWGWFVLMLLIAPIIHMLHFYVGHRLLHVKALYKHVHSLHHRNVQVGPWSGLSMHPVEHVIYFSTIVVQWLIALHPLNALHQIHLAAFPARPGALRIRENARVQRL